jgi:hypothetical protein
LTLTRKGATEGASHGGHMPFFIRWGTLVCR